MHRSDDVDRILSDMLDEATATMTKLSGGMAVCTFTKSGTPVPGIKYAEGQWSSLREAQRAIGRGDDADGVIKEGLDKWRAQLQSSIERDANRDWVAYHHGAVDALQELAERVGLASDN